MDNNFPDLNVKIGDQVTFTMVCLKKGTLQDVPSHINMVVGYNQQYKLTNVAVDFNANVGTVPLSSNLFYSKKRTAQENSDDDEESQPYQIKKTMNVNEIEYTRLQMNLLSVVEPCVWIKEYNFGQAGKYFYMVNRAGVEDKDTYRGSEAINAALGDMEVCYKNVLSLCRAKQETKDRIYIALPFLEVGIPMEKAAPIVVKSIVDFIRTCPHAYSVIYLLTTKNKLYRLCAELLQKEKNNKVK